MGPSQPSFVAGDPKGITTLRYDSDDSSFTVTVSNYIDGTGLDVNANGPLSTRRMQLSLTDTLKPASAHVPPGGPIQVLFIFGGMGAFALAKSTPGYPCAHPERARFCRRCTGAQLANASVLHAQ